MEGGFWIGKGRILFGDGDEMDIILSDFTLSPSR